jgi:hypothetical protein
MLPPIVGGRAILHGLIEAEPIPRQLPVRNTGLRPRRPSSCAPPLRAACVTITGFCFGCTDRKTKRSSKGALRQRLSHPVLRASTAPGAVGEGRRIVHLLPVRQKGNRRRPKFREDYCQKIGFNSYGGRNRGSTVSERVPRLRDAITPNELR